MVLRNRLAVSSLLLASLLIASSARAGGLKGRLVLPDAGGKPAALVTVSAAPWEDPFEEARREAKGVPPPKALAAVTTGPDGSFSLAVPADPANPGKEILFRVEWEGDGILPGRFEGAYEASETEDIGEKVVQKRLAAPKGSAKPPAPPAGAPIAGSVRKADKKTPAAGVLVRFEGKAATPWVETGEEGTFTIPRAPEGRGTLVADAGDAGWAAVPELRLPLPEGRPLVITLAPPAALEGRTVDEKTGKPVPRAKVAVSEGGFTRLSRSGPDGTYRLRVPPRAYSMTVDEARYVPWAKAAGAPLVPGETRRLDVALTPGATIAGKVVDENGTPVAGAKGSLAHGSESARAAFRRMAQPQAERVFRTAADGTFRASRLPPGDNEKLAVEHPDFERGTMAGLVLAAGATRAGLAVVLRRGLAIAGVVKDAKDQPLAGAEIEVLPSSGGFRGGPGGFGPNLARLAGAASRPRVKSGANGAFRTPSVGPGEYALIVRKSGYASERVEPVKVEAGEPAPVSVTLGPGASISGVVKRRSGDGAEGFFVRAGIAGAVQGLAGSVVPAGTEIATGPDGSFVIDGLKPRQAYDLTAYGGPGLGAPKRVVAPADGVEVEVSGTGRIAGTVVDARTGEFLKDFTASFEAERGGGGPGGFRFGARPGGAQNGAGIGEKHPFHTEGGTFALEDVPAGTWTVVVSAKSYQPARVSGVPVVEGATKEGVEVKVTAGTELKGHVTDARTGRPVANASVTYVAASAGPGGGGGGRGGPGGQAAAAAGGDEITTDADGRFTIDTLAPGRVSVTVRHPDYTDGNEIAEVKETGGTVELRLSAGTAIAGLVVAANQPVAGAEVALAGAGESGFGRVLGGSQTTQTDSSGHFRFDHLAAGRYTVSGGQSGKSSNLADVVLRTGESKEDLVLSLSGGATIQGIVSGLPDGWRSGTSISASGANGFNASTKAGADGSFQITGVPAGPVMLRALATDGSGTSRSANKQLTASDDVPVLQAEIVFDVGFTLTGRVTRADQPESNARVIANLQGGGGRLATTTTDGSGAYRLEGLQQGTYSVTASSDPATGGSTTRKTIALDGDQSLDLAIPTARVSGVVTDIDTKQPLPDATVSLAAAAGANAVGLQRAATTDSNGRFTFTDIPPQAYTLNARKPDYQFEKRDVTGADDGSSESITIELTRGAGLTLQARDGLYGVPLRSVSARVLDASRSPVFSGSVALDTNGSGEIPSLKPGSYSLTVNASGYAPVVIPNVNVPSQTVPVTLTPGGSADISVGPKSFVGGILRATLLSGGLPYPYTLFSLDGRLAITADATGQHGFRRLSNLAPGSYVLALDGGGAGTTFTVSEGGVTPVQLP
jgi:protocatechuate 3,4-dioxygenase beta subunit